MSNELRSLLARVEGQDPDTAKELRRHIDALQSRRQFGLNFERHTPESVALTGRPISVGDKVRFLPPRGETTVDSSATWTVTAITGPKKKQVAALLDPKTKSEASRSLDDLVFIADFRDPIYPGLETSSEPVLRGGDKPFHTVINAENYHALEALLFTHQGQVDCIYIDPPYNTGAKDWKYNNDYVDGEDAYRHSKWLAFMERRLKTARKLLNPRDSVLIVTIDEKEYLRLGLLLEQVFPDARIQMVSSVIKAGGSSRAGAFGRSEEFLYFVNVGQAAPIAQALSEEWNPVRTKNKFKLRWKNLMRSGQGARRADSPRLFYPIFVEVGPEGHRFHSVGDHWLGDRGDVTSPAGCATVWPLRQNGEEGRWMVSPAMLRELIAEGSAKLGLWKGDETTAYYLAAGERAKVQDGTFEVINRAPDGSVIVDDGAYVPRFLPTTQWSITSHDAGYGGARLLSQMLSGRAFPFPKSLYAVEDALRFYVSRKPDSLILDFFSGSGTMAHAVMRLNKQDGGRRRSISVTNNEVSSEEQKGLVKRQLRPGDPDWEALGICDYITKPRIKAAITGQTPGGDPIKGDYKFVDEFPMADGFKENVEFFTLTYENPALVELDLAFERIAPLLWMRAGSEGRRIDERTATFEVADTYAVLFNVDSSKPFLAAVEKADTLRIAYIVTDDETQYQAVAGQLPEGIESARLYESYLRTFQINTGRA